VAEQQLVEIAKSLNRKTQILIMDEPSAVLGEKDLEKLFEVVRSLQAQGIGIVYISHRLKEIFELADEVTVLKDGRYVGTRHVSEVTMDELVRMMIGRDLKDVYPRREPKLGEVLLDVKGLGRAKLVHDVSFQVRAGEIVGFAGITGSGRTEAGDPDPRYAGHEEERAPGDGDQQRRHRDDARERKGGEQKPNERLELAEVCHTNDRGVTGVRLVD
jgi:ribose transport system ATP-binding protein